VVLLFYLMDFKEEKNYTIYQLRFKNVGKKTRNSPNKKLFKKTTKSISKHETQVFN